MKQEESSAALHLFYVHSYITYLVALKVLEVAKIDKKDAVFLVNRGIVVNDEALKYYRVDKYCTYEGTAISRYFWKGWKLLGEINAFINNILKGRSFYFYTPHSSDNFMRILIAHKKCLGFSYLEEGSAAYYKMYHHNFPEITSIQKVNRFLNYGNSMPRLRFYEPHYLKAYGISQYSFPGFNRRVELKNVFRCDETTRKFDNAYIIVFDGLVEFKIVTLAKYFLATQKIIDHLEANNIKEVYFKLHPEQLKPVSGTGPVVKEFLNQHINIRFIELPNSAILENIAACNSNLTYYIFFSSVGFYAAVNGHKVYSAINTLEEGNAKIARQMSALPKAYTERIIRI